MGMFFAMAAILGFARDAGAASVYGVFPFQNTGAKPPSQYGNGSYPQSELLQASDGNYYGTTAEGGTGLCPSPVPPNFPVIGCGTIFRINAATGVETVLYSFPYEPANKLAPNGAYPLAGLIQGKDGALYGVASEGGKLSGYCYTIGCGTLFRISMTGAFTLLHQFSGEPFEGSQPINHLVQTADGTLYGTTSYGGIDFAGTLFSASTSGTVTTLYVFSGSNPNYPNGAGPDGALLVGQDGSTLYGTTEFGGAADTGTVFSYTTAAGLTTLHSFDKVTSNYPVGALIYGADGLLYGVTTDNSNDRGSFQGATVYSLSTTGGGFEVDGTIPHAYTNAGLLLGSDGMMYGTIAGVTNSKPGGGVVVYNPTTKALQLLVQFGTTTGTYPEAALIEGKDHYIYGSNLEGGPSNSFGAAEGTLFRIGPPLAK